MNTISVLPISPYPHIYIQQELDPIVYGAFIRDLFNATLERDAAGNWGWKHPNHCVSVDFKPDPKRIEQATTI